MSRSYEKSIFTYSEIINVLKNVLKKIDPRLICHGERVSYIVYEILKEGNLFDKFDCRKLFILSTFHDIGAYQIDEIDRMFQFDPHDVLDHSVYGYLLLKNMTSLSGYAEAVLCHHVGYSHLSLIDFKYKDYAALIHIADRIDVIIRQFGPDYDFTKLRKFAPSMFSPEYVELFIRANEKENIAEKVDSGKYELEMFDTKKCFEITSEEAENFLRMIIYIIDFRSHSTVTHTVKTSFISLKLAKMLGLSDKNVKEVYYGAFLHDIGKIAVPTEILESSEKLNEEEMKIMRKHVEYTEDILRGVIDDKICDIAVRHHEKLDGSGYPNHYKDKDLTLQQKIVSVADIVSALTDVRSYKDAYPKEETIEIIEDMDNQGKLCSRICRILIDNYDEIMKSTQEYSKPTLKLYKTISLEYNKVKEKLI